MCEAYENVTKILGAVIQYSILTYSR